jgi:hypothetical protein
VAGSCFKEGQDVCDIWPDSRVLVPTLFRQHPDIFREAKNLPIRWPRGSLASEDQPRYKKRANVRERLSVCEDLQSNSLG